MRLAKLHPDRSSDPDAGAHFADFKQLTNATMSSEEKREAYDQQLEELAGHMDVVRLDAE